MSKLEIDKILTISTAHIKKETGDLLDDEPYTDELGLVVYSKSKFGWFIFIPTETDDVMEILEDKNIPDDLIDCIRFAWEHNCNWLCLDSDASEVDELETYEW